MVTTPRRHLPVTTQRRNQFLAALRATGGVFSAACRVIAVDPRSNKAGRPCFSTWKLLAKNDPEFAEQVADILAEACGAVEQEIMRRGQLGWEEPIYQRGERVMDVDAHGQPIKASIRRFSDKLLLARAKSLMPGKYGADSQHSVTHSGHITHGALSMQDLRAMTPAERDQVEQAFQLIQRVQRGEEPLALEHKPGSLLAHVGSQVIDTDFEDVTERAEAVEAVEAAEQLALRAERAEAVEAVETFPEWDETDEVAG